MSELESEQAVPETPEAAEPDAPAEEWSGVSREDYQQLTSTLEEQREALEYMYGRLGPVFDGPQQQPQGPEPVQLDPLDDNFQSQLDQYIDQKFSGYQEYVQAQQFREGEARAQDIIADDIAANGDFVFAESKDKARALANNYIGEMNQQYPRDPGKAAEAALHKAAQDVRDWETAVGKAYHEQQLNQLSSLSGARPQPGVGTNGTQQFTIPEGGGLLDVVGRHVRG